MYFLRNTYPAQSADSGSAGSEGAIECQISSNHLLKLVNLAEIFTGNSVYILEWIFCWSLLLEGHIRNFSSGGWGWSGSPPPPIGGRCQIYHNVDNLKPLFNFRLVLKINEDIVGSFGALHVWTEIICAQYYCLNWSQIHVNQPKPVPDIGL